MFKLTGKEYIPNVPPFYTAKMKYLQNILFSIDKKERKYNNYVYSALTFGWRGWTDGALWLLHQLPNTVKRKETRFIYTSIVATKEQMHEKFRRYTHISDLPALRYRNIELNMKHTKLYHEYMIFADLRRAILIPQVHVRILFHTILRPMTFWIHPIENSYTVTCDNQIVAFGLALPDYAHPNCRNLIELNKRRAVLQIRRWWETRIHRYTFKTDTSPLFGWRKIKN